MPSAVSRLRSHVRQNGSVVDAMMPNVVPSGEREALGRRRRSRLVDRRDRAVVARRARRASRAARRRGRATSGVAPPTSMYSMKRTSASTARPYSIRSTSSSSLTPRMTTVSILSRPKTRRAAAMPAWTRVELVEARQRLEAIAVQRVEADRDASEPGGLAARRSDRRAARRWS